MDSLMVLKSIASYIKWFGFCLGVNFFIGIICDLSFNWYNILPMLVISIVLATFGTIWDLT